MWKCISWKEKLLLSCNRIRAISPVASHRLLTDTFKLDVYSKQWFPNPLTLSSLSSSTVLSPFSEHCALCAHELTECYCFDRSRFNGLALIYSFRAIHILESSSQFRLIVFLLPPKNCWKYGLKSSFISPHSTPLRSPSFYEGKI